MKMDKKLLASQRLCPLTPAGSSTPKPPFRLALCVLAMVRPHSPLANPRTATGSHAKLVECDSTQVGLEMVLGCCS